MRNVPDWLDVSRETLTKLEAFLDLVAKWNTKINLVSSASVDHAWTRHILDSAQLWVLAQPQNGVWLDIGSGGGFPGLVISIIAQEMAPDLQIVLVESDRRKAVFLAEVVRQLQLSAKLHGDRIENLPPLNANIISARALAALNDLLPMAVRHLHPDGIALFPKGARFQTELDLSRKTWAFQAEAVTSKTDPSSAILKVWGLHHV